MKAIRSAFAPAVRPAISDVLFAREKPIDLEKTILDLFKNGEVGAWYDLSDINSLRQNVVGSAVSANGQPVAIVLDKSQDLRRGPEVLINGNFANGGASWTVSGVDATHYVEYGADGARFVSGTTTPILTLGSSQTLIPGRVYELTVDCSRRISGSVKMIESVNGQFNVSAVGVTRTIFVAASTLIAITRAEQNVDMTFRSVSVREILGNHLIQTTSANRPTYVATPGKSSISFNGTNQFLNTAENLNLSSSSSASVFGAFNVAQMNGAIRVLANLNGLSPGAISIRAPSDLMDLHARFFGASGNALTTSKAFGAGSFDAVLSLKANLALSESSMRINKELVSTSNTPTGGGNFANTQLFIGSGSGGLSNFFSGTLNNLIVRNADTNASDVLKIERYLAGKI